MDNSFSFASVILSYFLVGGGMFIATLIGTELRLTGALAAYGLLAAGAFAGGFVAARASRGQTILEPAIGAVAVVATIAGLAGATPIGKAIWVLAQDETLTFIGAVGGTGVIGALVGAWLSEKLLGEATTSTLPWLVYAAMSSFGACLLATLFASILFFGGNRAIGRTDADLSMILLVGIGAGCLLSGLAIGASARVRPLFAALIGGGLGVAGYFRLVTRTTPADQSDAITGILVLAAAGAFVTLIGAALGWITAGRRHPG